MMLVELAPHLPSMPPPAMAVFAVDDFLIALAVTAVSTAISAAISALTRPKPTAPTAATLADLDVPTAEDGRPVPRVFGTVWLTAPNVHWYGDFRTEPIKQGVGK